MAARYDCSFGGGRELVAVRKFADIIKSTATISLARASLPNSECLIAQFYCYYFVRYLLHANLRALFCSTQADDKERKQALYTSPADFLTIEIRSILTHGLSQRPTAAETKLTV